MAGKKKKTKEETVIEPAEQPESPEPQYAPQSQGIDYKEKLAYGNLMSELIGLVSFAINRGGDGQTELETVWMNLLPEIKEELNEFYTEQNNMLRAEIASVPDGLVQYNEDSKRWESVGDSNNRVLNVKELLNPANRGIVHELIFDSTINKRETRHSGELKHLITRAYVREVVPELIKALQNHNLLMQTKKRTVVGGDVLRESSGDNTDGQ